jgi:hypothetical protein
MTAGERPTRALAVRRIGAARWPGDSVVAPGGPENRTEEEGCRGELSAVESSPAAQHTLWRGRLRRERRGLDGTAECEVKTLSRIRSRTHLSQPFRRGRRRREIVDSGLARSRTIVRDRPVYRNALEPRPARFPQCPPVPPAIAATEPRPTRRPFRPSPRD